MMSRCVVIKKTDYARKFPTRGTPLERRLKCKERVTPDRCVTVPYTVRPNGTPDRTDGDAMKPLNGKGASPVQAASSNAKSNSTPRCARHVALARRERDAPPRRTRARRACVRVTRQTRRHSPGTEGQGELSPTDARDVRRGRTHRHALAHTGCGSRGCAVDRPRPGSASR